jgi:hypothetical protein
MLSMSLILLPLLVATALLCGCAETQQQPEPADVPAPAAKPVVVTPQPPPLPLIDLNDPQEQARVSHHRGELTWADGTLSYRVPANRGGTVTIQPPNEGWDLRDYTRIALDLEAIAGEEIKIKAVVPNPGANGWSKHSVAMIYLDQGQRATRPLYLVRSSKDRDTNYPELQVFEGMNGLPGGSFKHWINVDPTKLVHLKINVMPRPYAQEIRIHSIGAASPIVPPELREMGDAFFPFIDTYGQYRHGTWPGKITSDHDLTQGFVDERRDLAAHPRPSDHNKWGGWKDGPQRDANGFFRTEKVDGKWWLIDPDGHLFWSHGVTGVGVGGATTRVLKREHYFVMPKDGDPLAQFRSNKNFDFTAANLYRALGPDWRAKYIALSHQRLASWGMNTLAMWSQPEAMLLRKTPYTVAIHYGYASINDKLPDPFAPGFRNAVRESLERRKDTAGDPWCIGYFVNNELHWKQPLQTVQYVVRGKPEMAAKKKLVEQLRKSYPTIDALNAKLGTTFADWDALLANREPVDLKKIRADTEQFYRAICEAFFSICREEVKRMAPRQLYMGCRFHTYNRIVMSVAAKYCDVISYNLYEYGIAQKRWPGVDKPFIATEFHFGAQDRGMWGIGLRWASSQQDRARLYRDYVRGALTNPMCVGTHWFQYNSQAFSGRRDGENYQVGMTDIGGRPWPELRDAVRQVGHSMYQLRHAGQ